MYGSARPCRSMTQNGSTLDATAIFSRLQPRHSISSLSLDIGPNLDRFGVSSSWNIAVATKISARDREREMMHCAALLALVDVVRRRAKGMTIGWW